MFVNTLKKSWVYIVVIVAAVTANIIFSANSLYCIQEYGIKTYNTVSVIVKAVSGIAAVLSIVMILLNYRHEKNMSSLKNIYEQKQQALAEKEKRNRAELSVSGSLDPDYIYSRLEDFRDSEWGDKTEWKIPQYIEILQDQLQEMEMYSEKLSGLLENNGATYMEDTTDLMNKVEQYILRNIRKVLNCMDVYDADEETDLNRLSALMKQVTEDNDNQSVNIKDFLLAVTDFINKQGDDSSDLERLDIYKTTILESIKEDNL